jgi:hypothetical protein
MKDKYCEKCFKKISKNAKRCRSCSKKGKRNGLYTHGIFSKKRVCLDCDKELKGHSKEIKRCKKCSKIKFFKSHPLFYKGTRNPMFGIHRYGKNNPNYNKHTLNGKTIEKHHIDLNRNNNSKNNILFIQLKNHRRLHLYAYRYLVKKGLIKRYIKWFFKYGYKTEKYKR